MSVKKAAKTPIEKSISLLKLSSDEARAFFLKGESYCNFDLPPYFEFDTLLGKISKLLAGKELKSFKKPDCGPRDFDDLNHTIYHNKDGKFAWRPFDLSHPALYVSLVHQITEDEAWKAICDQFKVFAENKKIICASLPVMSKSRKSDKAEQILHWWTDLEQRSIELSIEYEHVAHTDITDCYSSIYTHSVVWALHGQAEAKKKENRNNPKFIGSVIDGHLQDMNYGQTNGIPQGSVLMDFVAEIVLGYADTIITQKIKDAKIRDYTILRYRDDYRVFVNNPAAGNEIVKIISQVLLGLGLKLSATKTKFSSSVIKESVKADKMDWNRSKQSHPYFQKHLLLIHGFSLEHPNSGSLVRALTSFHRRLEKQKRAIQNVLPMIAIVVDIACRNPRTYSISAAILSNLFASIGSIREKEMIFKKMRKRFESVPNTGQLQIWLQRISRSFDESLTYEEPLCALVNGENVSLWNSSWINSPQLKTALRSKAILDKKALKAIKPVIQSKEVELFEPYPF